MELLLRKDVPSLGKAGDVVKVAAGYARNYLLPQKLATEVTAENQRLIVQEQGRARKTAEAERLQKLEVAKKLETVSATIAAKANEEGKLFGSVSQKEVADALAAEGVQVAPEAIGLAEEGRTFPIKELGVYLLKISLGSEVEAATKLWVVQE